MLLDQKNKLSTEEEKKSTRTGLHAAAENQRNGGLMWTNC